MPVKSIVILANSYKHHRRCIAGKEVHRSDDGSWRATDQWYRPVTTDVATHGAIPLGVCRDLTTHQEFQPMDIVEIDFNSPAPEPGQPENWRFNIGTHWSKVGRFGQAEAADLLDSPADIWNDGATTNTSLVTEAYRDAGHVTSSLLLIRPNGLRLHLNNEHNPWKHCYEKKMKASFNYNGVDYCGITVTDPAILAAYGNSYPSQGDPESTITLPGGDRYSLCISLAPPFPGNHNTQSKLLAAVIGH